MSMSLPMMEMCHLFSERKLSGACQICLKKHYSRKSSTQKSSSARITYFSVCPYACTMIYNIYSKINFNVMITYSLRHDLVG